MLRGETTKRSELDPDKLAAKLQAHGVARLRGAPTIWVIFDGSDLRKPYAARMEHLQPVKARIGSAVKRLKVCTSCIKAGKVARAV